MSTPDALAVLADALLERMDKQIEQSNVLIEQNQAIIALLSAEEQDEQSHATVMTQLGPVHIEGLQKR